MSDPTPSSSAPVLDYATPVVLEPAEWLRRTAVGCWAITAGGAVAILLAYALTRWWVFPLIGLYWLAGGGLFTLAAIINGSIYLYQSHRARYPGPHTRRCAWLALLLPLSNVLLAILCVMAAVWLAAMFDPMGADD